MIYVHAATKTGSKNAKIANRLPVARQQNHECGSCPAAKNKILSMGMHRAFRCCSEGEA